MEGSFGDPELIECSPSRAGLIELSSRCVTAAAITDP